MSGGRVEQLARTVAMWRDRALEAEKSAEQLMSMKEQEATLGSILVRDYGGMLDGETPMQAAARILRVSDGS